MAWSNGVRGPGLTAAAVAVAAVTAGCSSSGTEQPQGTSSGSAFSQRMSSLFFGTPAEQANALANSADPNLDCPVTDVRGGASTLRLPADAEPSSGTLRYQATIARVARECQVRGANMTVRVGVQGRVIIGPAGGPGQIEIPLRYAVIRDGPEPKPILTKLHRFPVTIGDGQSSAPFLHIEEDLTFVVPRGSELESYVVYVGFDPGAVKEPPAKKGRKGR